MLKVYAKHYQTGEVIPDELIEKIEKASKFNTGFTTVEYLAASSLDMEYHSLTEPAEINVGEFERKAMEKYGLISEIIPRYRSTYFSHIFSGGYSIHLRKGFGVVASRLRPSDGPREPAERTDGRWEIPGNYDILIAGAGPVRPTSGL